jgi:dTDP-4-amino-4,6-dideoxygalactose transaminase
MATAVSVPARLVPVMRPRLPRAEALLPYLQRIDTDRVYSNFGPLVGELERRLASLMRVPPGSVVLAASGATALSGAILAAAGRARSERPLAVVPDHTFVATALAAELCGYRVVLADVAEPTWTLDPERLREHPRLAEVGLVVPVTPYGRPILQAPWLAFRDATGIPVVVDGAASFEAVTDDPQRLLGPLPVVLSFHATKSFATGEGGAVVCADHALARRVVRALNYGFFDTRDCTSASLNGKMSEYHAAVGMAELDGWPAKQASFRQVHDLYFRLLRDAGLSAGFLGMPEVAACYALFRCAEPAEATSLRARLDAAGIGHRMWYGLGLHAQTHFADCENDGLETSRRLAPCLLGLPMAPDLLADAIERVVGCLRGCASTGRV